MVCICKLFFLDSAYLHSPKVTETIQILYISFHCLLYFSWILHCDSLTITMPGTPEKHAPPPKVIKIIVSLEHCNRQIVAIRRIDDFKDESQFCGLPEMPLVCSRQPEGGRMSPISI